MSQNSKRFSRHLCHPVTLLTVASGGKENLATMAWVSAVSFNPPLLMVAVHPKRFSHNMVLDAKEFGIIVLSDQQKNLSTLAGTRTGRKENKWDLEPFARNRMEAKLIRAPLLNNCHAVYECRLVNHLMAGDHTIFVGEVLRSEVNEDLTPLLLFNRKYFSIGKFIADYP